MRHDPAQGKLSFINGEIKCNNTVSLVKACSDSLECLHNGVNCAVFRRVYCNHWTIANVSTRRTNSWDHDVECAPAKCRSLISSMIDRRPQFLFGLSRNQAKSWLSITRVPRHLGNCNHLVLFLRTMSQMASYHTLQTRGWWRGGKGWLQRSSSGQMICHGLRRWFGTKRFLLISNNGSCMSRLLNIKSIFVQIFIVCSRLYEGTRDNIWWNNEAKFHWFLKLGWCKLCQRHWKRNSNPFCWTR